MKFLLKTFLITFAFSQIAVAGRMFDPEVGRFISRDPLGYVDGMSLYNAYFAERFSLDPTGNQLQDIIAVDHTKDEAIKRFKKGTGGSIQPNPNNMRVQEGKGLICWVGPWGYICEKNFKCDSFAVQKINRVMRMAWKEQDGRVLQNQRNVNFIEGFSTHISKPHDMHMSAVPVFPTLIAYQSVVEIEYCCGTARLEPLYINSGGYYKYDCPEEKEKLELEWGLNVHCKGKSHKFKLTFDFDLKNNPNGRLIIE